MKKAVIIILLAGLAGAVGFFLMWNRDGNGEPTGPGGAPEEQLNNPNMLIASAAFERNGPIPAKYTCDGENISPPLTFSGVPEETKSLALIMDDPDAPRGTWVHWTMWNIDPATINVAANSIPPGAVEGKTSAGKSGYGGPCPPSGTHRYYFKLYALDANLNLDESANKQDLEGVMAGHVLGQAELIGLYSRQ